MSVGQEFWIVATGCSKSQTGEGYQSEKEVYLAELKRHAVLSPSGSGNSPSTNGPWKFNVPDGECSLIFGSFDNLMRLTDDLQKYDSQVDSILHRLERQHIELEPKAEFKVRSQRQEKPFAEYLKNWQWDEAKYPKTRSVTENVTLLMSVVNRLDEEARNKTAQYNELKTQKSNIAKKDGTSLANRDLIDVLTPDVVRMGGTPDDDFIMTEHLTTVPVILPRGGEQEFLALYESMQECVVPMSAKKFPGVDDKDGNSLWRVVMFKSATEGFKKKCREKRFIVKDFEYSEETYKKLKAQREQVEDSVKRQFELLRGLYQAAWSDAMVAWIHIKAMRVFVESVLRFGMPPCFAAFIVSPKSSAVVPARKALADTLGKQAPAGPYSGKAADPAQQEEGDEYYPYVSLSFTPFTVPRNV